MSELAATRVGRARVRGVDTDAATARLRLGNLLAGSELRPSGLAPSAVLCVRRVIDPLPGALRLETAEARPPPEWERAFVDALEQALRTAARPAREAVPAGAEAVLFADRAELLACLARDARDGTAWSRWWWRSLRAETAPGADPVVATWLSAPEHVPAALALLAARGEAVAFAASLPPPAAATLAERVAHVFGAAELQRALVSTAPAPAAAEPGAAPAAPRAAEPPWRELVPEAAAPTLEPRQELLLGIALALRRSPSTARGSGFAAAVRAWLLRPLPEPGVPRPEEPVPEQVQAAEPAPLVPPDPPAPAASRAARAPEPPPDHASAVSAPRSAALSEEAQLVQSVPSEPEHEPPPPGRAEPPRSAESSPPPVADTEAPAQAPEPRPADEPSPPSRRPRVVPERPKPQRRAPRAREEPAPQPARLAPAPPPPAATPSGPEPEPEPPWGSAALVVETELGGVFYLLNLALFLGLYGDFTRPLEPGIALDPWTYLRLLSRRLLGLPERRDPLWGLLTRLAGPSAFRPPRAWRTPRAWLEPFEHDGVWRWSAARGTLRLVHPAGFTVVAVPRTAAPARAQLARELARLRLDPALRRSALPPEPAAPLARWIARLAAYADARLRVALGLLAPDAALDELLLRHRARVFVTATHVDVVLRLTELPLEVRFAGLDRTPGWVPAAGRFVSLHFE